MENQVSRRNKRYKAKRLFFTNKYTSREICAMVDVTEATMSKWIKNYGWKNPADAGLRPTVKAFGIISMAFYEHLTNNNPALLKGIGDEIKIYMDMTTGKNAVPATEDQKAEIMDMFNDSELKGKAFDGVIVDQVATLGYEKAERLIKLFNARNQPTVELTVQKSNPLNL